MNVDDPGDPLLPRRRHGHHTSARERQRQGPMWRVLKRIFKIILFVFVLLAIIIGGGWWYLGTSNFAGLVMLRIERTLEARLGRDVYIHDVIIDRAKQRVIINDLRIANAPGGVAKYFATVRQIEISGGIDSFWGRKVKIGRVDIRDPKLWFEIFPNGTHNFPHWKTGPKGKYEIVHLDIGKLFIAGGNFSFLDRKHDIEAVSTAMASTITVTRAEDLYAGIMTSPSVRVRIQNYVPFVTDLRGGFRYTPGVLALESIALRGRGIEAFVHGKLDPLTEGQYDLRVTSRLSLERIKEIFRLEKKLEGDIALDTRLHGKQGNFTMDGGWVASRIEADAYELTQAKGKLNITGEKAIVDVESARYGGGTISAHYDLAKYAEPYPMSVNLRYNGISLEQLFNDWTIENTGIRAAATGTLTYRWNKDKLLDGSGSGTATLAKNATAFSNAKYPIPIAGKTDFTLDRGVVGFRSAELDTDASHISLTGTLRIEDVATDFTMAIKSSDFSELDRIGYNFAHSAGKNDYTLLGLGGAGDITGSVKGPLKTPQVAAHIVASNAKYNDVLLGDANINLQYDGNKGVLSFVAPTILSVDSGRLALTGTVAFPESGPSPRFDITADANGYPADRAIAAVGLDLKIGPGLATGKMTVAGTPEEGRVSFDGLTVRRANADLKLNGGINWHPGKGNIELDLDIAANNFPVADILTFLDLGTFPVTGDLTGTLQLKGPKKQLEGRGSVIVKNGKIYGEPVEQASADIEFTQGKMRAKNIVVRSAAGEIKGEAELNLDTEQFSYTIESGALDLSRLEILKSLQGLFGGKLTIKSTGAGTFDKPELVVEATLSDAALRGLTLPEGTAPPSLYIAIRGGRLVVRGALADILNIEGEGAVGENQSIDGNVRVTVTNVTKFLQLFPATATLPASGSFVVDLKLGGRLSPLDALAIDGTFPQFNLKIAEHEFTAPQPLRFSLRNGRINFDQFELQHPDSTFSVTGFAEITGDKRLDVNVRGGIEAALLQLFVTDLRASGHVAVSMNVTGTLANPHLTGGAELRDASMKFSGFPQLIDDINGTVQFRGDRIDIESLRATVGGGRVVLGGFITVDGLKPQRARLTIQGSEVAIRYYEGLTVEGNFNLLLTGDLERIVVQGDVNVTRALYFKDFNFQQSLLNVILSRRGITPVVAANWQDRVELRLHLVAPETLAVKNNLADVTGSAEIDLSGTLANPVVLGEINLDEGGVVTFQKIEYHLVRGTITFQNPFRIDPYFDITLEGRVSSNISEIESGPVELTVNITGTLDRITPTITSDPPASDITLFSILGFGGLTSNRGGGTTNGASAGLVGNSLLQQSIGSYLGSRILPFADSFTFDPGLLETGVGAGPKVTFEKRVSNNIRLLVVYNIDSHESREVIEWFVNRDWTLQLTRDDTSNEYRIDARFRRRYEGRWSFRSAAAMPPLSESGGVATALQRTTDVQPHASVGQNIARIDLRADARFDTAPMNELLALKVGEPVTIRNLQSSIKNLFATGHFRDVRIDAKPGEGGVVITVSLFLQYRVGDIHFAGIKGSDRTRAQRDLTVRTGDVFSLNAVDDSAQAIQTELNHLGYLEATVDPETNFDRDRSLADVKFDVHTGPRAEIANVVIEGDTRPFAPAALIKQMRRGPGRSYRLIDARADADRIKNFLLNRNYRRADVDYLGHTYDTNMHRVTLRYRATVGPTVKVEVAGVPRSTVRKWLPFHKNQEYSADTIDRAADQMVKGLQERGYFHAAVDTEGRLEGDTWITTFTVSPGIRYRLADVEFTGNERISDKKLAGIIETSSSGGIKRLIATLFRRPTGVTQTQLNSDRDALESDYRLNGFSEAVVATPVVATDDAKATMSVTFPITEGPQTLLADVHVEGNEKFVTHALPKLVLKPGDPLNPQLERDDLVALQTFYADRGYTEVQVTPRAEISADKTSAKLAYVVSEGPRVNVDEVIVRGNTYTNSEVVRRTADIEKDDPFSYTRILEAQRDLYRLGIFQRVEIQPEQTGTSVGDRDIVIQVEEGKNLTVTGALGVRAQEVGKEQVVEPRVAAAVAHRNLFGTGRYLGLETVFSPQEREAFLTFREPFIGKWNVPVQVTAYQTDDKTRPGLHVIQRGTFIEASKVAKLRTRWSLRYEYKLSKCKIEPDPGDLCSLIENNVPVADLDRSLLNIQISSIAPTFFWDTRDDIIDPHRGFFTSATVEYAFPFIQADANFTKEFVQGSYYLPISQRNVAVFSARLGLIQQGTKGGDLVPVPLSERFTAGGDTSHRGFPLDLLGTLCVDPRDFEDGKCEPTLYRASNGDILPLGGNSEFIANAEYRFPIFGTLGGAVFADIGNVYAESRIDLRQVRYGVGFGLRYLSPVGPLRFDVGWPLQRRVTAFDDMGNPSERERAFSYFITFGYAF